MVRPERSLLVLLYYLKIIIFLAADLKFQLVKKSVERFPIMNFTRLEKGMLLWEAGILVISKHKSYEH
jgi:hypothetical protein